MAMLLEFTSLVETGASFAIGSDRLFDPAMEIALPHWELKESEKG